MHIRTIIDFQNVYKKNPIKKTYDKYLMYILENNKIRLSGTQS